MFWVGEWLAERMHPMADVEPIQRDDKPAAPAAAPAKKRAWLFPVLAVVAALAVGGGAYFAGRATADDGSDGDDSEHSEADAEDEADEDAADNAKKPAADKSAKTDKKGKKDKKDKSKAVKQTPLFYAMEPAFVVNYQDLQALRFLQVGVQVMAYDQAGLDAIKANEPQARNALVMLFSGQAYDTLISREGKEKLREDALLELRKVIGDPAGKESLQAVYFTSFVMQ